MKKIIPLVLPLLFYSCTNNSGRTPQEKIDYLIQERFKNKEFVGSVLVADSGKIIYQKSFGKADQKGNLQHTDTTKFLIASISKPITSVLILRLVSKGLVSLEDTLNKYFKITDSNVSKITVHHLLDSYIRNL
jgi:CubicO group peptidase (beta-lactamase class C family)